MSRKKHLSASVQLEEGIALKLPVTRRIRLCSHRGDGEMRGLERERRRVGEGRGRQREEKIV